MTRLTEIASSFCTAAFALMVFLGIASTQLGILHGNEQLSETCIEEDRCVERYYPYDCYDGATCNTDAGGHCECEDNSQTDFNCDCVRTS